MLHLNLASNEGEKLMSNAMTKLVMNEHPEIKGVRPRQRSHPTCPYKITNITTQPLHGLSQKAH